jgi:[ribosomal protein S5]-alanine N-acetyltransferase
MSRMIETARLQLRPSRGEAGPEGHWALHRRDDGVVVGGVSLAFTPRGSESLAIDWTLVPAARGHGYATEAGEAVARWAIHEAGVPEVFALVPPDNGPAMATAQRIGMEWVTDRGPFHLYRIRHGDLDDRA